MLEYALMTVLLTGSTADAPHTFAVYADQAACAEQMDASEALIRRMGFADAITLCKTVVESPRPKRRSKEFE